MAKRQLQATMAPEGSWTHADSCPGIDISPALEEQLKGLEYMQEHAPVTDCTESLATGFRFCSAHTQQV